MNVLVYGGGASGSRNTSLHGFSHYHTRACSQLMCTTMISKNTLTLRDVPKHGVDNDSDAGWHFERQKAGRLSEREIVGTSSQKEGMQWLTSIFINEVAFCTYPCLRLGHGMTGDGFSSNRRRLWRVDRFPKSPRPRTRNQVRTITMDLCLKKE